MCLSALHSVVVCDEESVVLCRQRALRRSKQLVVYAQKMFWFADTPPCTSAVNTLVRANKGSFRTREATAVTCVDVVAKVAACHATGRPNRNVAVARETDRLVLRDMEGCG